MNDLGPYRGQVFEEKITDIEKLGESGDPSPLGLIIDALRYWRVVLWIFFAICAIGIPAIWFLKKPVYEVTGAIRVAPILMNILSGEADEGEISNYQSFMNTEAVRITSGPVVQRVADDLADKDLAFFKEGVSSSVKKLERALKGDKAKHEPASVLKEAIADEVIVANADRNSELIIIKMKSKKPQEARQIVDTFIRAYTAVEVSSSADVENQKLNLLENERKVLSQKMQNQRKAISQLAQEFGDKNLEDRRDMKMKRVASLLAQVTEYEARRIHLEAEVELLEKAERGQTIGQEELLQMRNDYINAEPGIRAFAERITQLEQELIVARQRLTESNPELKSKIELLEALKARVEKLKEEAGKTFDNLMAERMAKASKEKLIQARAELEQTRIYEQRFRDLLSEEDNETIGVGRTQVAIQDLEDELAFTKETYDIISRRIKELEMERKRPARISVAYNADVTLVNDKRLKFTVAAMFGGIACGMFVAFLMAKADQRLRTPDDVAKRIGGWVLGTTTGVEYLERALLPERLAEDYQTIRANLELFNINGEGIPKKLVITSPGLGEGKTTFAINLAASISKTGKKVLLIDGDLRKSDISYLLNLPQDLGELQDVFLGLEYEKYIRRVPSIGLDVLAAKAGNSLQIYEVLNALDKAQSIDDISQKYDHVIIDTPPALVFPDALVWAKIAGAVILVGFAGQTTAPAMREVKERLANINIAVLGTVLNNVRTSQGYYRYAYNYSERNNRNRIKEGGDQAGIEEFLLPVRKRGNKSKDSNT